MISSGLSNNYILFETPHPGFLGKESLLPSFDINFCNSKPPQVHGHRYHVIKNKSPLRKKEGLGFSLQALKNPKENTPDIAEIENILDQIEDGALKGKISKKECNELLEIILAYAEEGSSDPEEKELLRKEFQSLIKDLREADFEQDFQPHGLKTHLLLVSKKKDKYKKTVWKKLGKFFKKHRKAIVIGLCVAAGIAVATVVTIAAVNSLGVAAAAETVGAGAAAAGGVISASQPAEEENDETSSEPFKEMTADARIDAPPPISDSSREKEIAFLEKCMEFDPIHPMQDPDILAKELGLDQDPHFSDQWNQYLPKSYTNVAKPLKEFRHGFALGMCRGIHEAGSSALDAGKSFVIQPIETVEQMLNSVRDLTYLALNDQWGELSEALTPAGYQLVTEWKKLSSKERGKLAGEALGRGGSDLLFAGAGAKMLSKGLSGAERLLEVSKAVKKVKPVQISTQAAELGKELGIRKMYKLKEAGKLKPSLHAVYENSFKSALQLESFELFERAQSALKKYKNEFIPEIRARTIIEKTGVPTFPRPNGIPKNYKIQISDKSAGIIYIHPTNRHLSIRVMPGKPHSSFPHQQKPYVIQMNSGKALDAYGNLVIPDSPEAHIPIDKFKYRKQAHVK